jgi:formate hydrogenlyase subunit 3/multisubunit Na+/H+ antiporter MnhD subunit
MPENDDKDLEKIVLTRVMRLSVVITGITVGLVLGFLLFAVTIFLLLKGGSVVGPHLGMLGNFLPGYDVTLLGSFLGLGYGFVIGFVLGCFVAFVYNWLIERKEMSTQRKGAR